MPATAKKKKTTTTSKSEISTAIDAFRRILRELRVAARRTELATGLSAAQLFVLSAVAASPGCSVNDIAAATMTDRSSAAAVIDRLLAQGHITRKQSGDDRRRASIEITARGRRAMTRSASAPAPTSLLVDGLRALSSADLQRLAASLAALTGAMGIADTPAGMFFEEAPSARRKQRR
jgi:DNA-binding MarR family transcriptional regulator